MSSSWHDMKRYRRVGFGGNHEKAFFGSEIGPQVQGVSIIAG